MEFRDRLKELRRQKHITQETLGRAIHVSRSLIAKWEAGLGVPSEDLIDALCAYFEVEQKQLLLDTATEEVFVDKNLKIRRGKRLIAALGAIIVGLTVICSCWGIYKGVESTRHKREVEVMKTLVPTVQKVYFENPTMVNVEDKVPIVDGKYVLKRDKWTKIYFEIDVDERICKSWYSFTVEFDGFDTIGLQELSYYEIEKGMIIYHRFRCFVYIRPQSADVSQLALHTATYFHTIDGEGWNVDCKNVAKPVFVSVQQEE